MPLLQINRVFKKSPLVIKRIYSPPMDRPQTNMSSLLTLFLGEFIEHFNFCRIHYIYRQKRAEIAFKCLLFSIDLTNFEWRPPYRRIYSLMQ